jgi:DNA-binding HxlR family transcriptional regulator
MPLGTDYARQDCSLARSLEVVGERWTLLILRDCFFGVRRFSDFQAHLDISRAVLSARLDALVADGLLTRTGTGHPEYALTEEAMGLWPALYALGRWGDRRTTPDAPRRLYTHVGCGPLGAEGRCETCDRAPAVADIEVRPGPGADPTLRDDPVSVALRKPHRLLTPLAVR